jgi:hypothetical protein
VAAVLALILILILILIAVVWAALLLLAWALCRMAALADESSERACRVPPVLRTDTERSSTYGD